MRKERIKSLVGIGAAVLSIALLCGTMVLVMRGCSGTQQEVSKQEEMQPASNASATDNADIVEPDGNKDESAAPGGESPGAGAEIDIGEEYVDYEDNTAVATIGEYANDRVVTYDYGSGTISVGINAAKYTDALYINPVCSEATATQEGQVGFYISSTSGELYFQEFEGNKPTDGANAKEANLVLLQESFNWATSARFVDAQNYGVMWCRDELSNDYDNGGTTLYIRAIRLHTGRLLAICRVSIMYDSSSDTHYIGKIESNDVVDTGEMTKEEKQALAQQAVDAMRASNHVATGDEEWAKAAASAKIEHIAEPYFINMRNMDGKPDKSYKYSNCEIWAVNLQLPADFVTVYFAPHLQIIGFERPTEPGKSELNLKPIGYANLDHRVDY